MSKKTLLVSFAALTLVIPAWGHQLPQLWDLYKELPAVPPSSPTYWANCDVERNVGYRSLYKSGYSTNYAANYSSERNCDYDSGYSPNAAPSADR